MRRDQHTISEKRTIERKRSSTLHVIRGRTRLSTWLLGYLTDQSEYIVHVHVVQRVISRSTCLVGEQLIPQQLTLPPDLSLLSSTKTTRYVQPSPLLATGNALTYRLNIVDSVLPSQCYPTTRPRQYIPAALAPATTSPLRPSDKPDRIFSSTRSYKLYAFTIEPFAFLGCIWDGKRSATLLKRENISRDRVLVASLPRANKDRR